MHHRHFSDPEAMSISFTISAFAHTVATNRYFISKSVFQRE